MMMPRSTLWLPLLNLVGLMVLLGWILVRDRAAGGRHSADV